YLIHLIFFFFFQAEDGIRDFHVTGVQTCALPIFEQNCAACHSVKGRGGMVGPQLDGVGNWGVKALVEKILIPNRNITQAFRTYRSEERRVGKECRSRWSREHQRTEDNKLTVDRST